MFKNFFTFVFELVKIIVISLAIIFPIRYFLIQPFYVKGASMEPNFFDQEYLIINEIDYRFNQPKRGDIVVFRYPRNPQEYFIKRVIGLPGERVQFKAGDIYIINKDNPSGVLLKEPYLPEGLKTFSLTDEIITVGEKEFYVLGDNRNSSKDSRSFGAVNKSFFIGKVMLRGWPFNRIHYFDNQPYSL